MNSHLALISWTSNCLKLVFRVEWITLRGNYPSSWDEGIGVSLVQTFTLNIHNYFLFSKNMPLTLWSAPSHSHNNKPQSVTCDHLYPAVCTHYQVLRIIPFEWQTHLQMLFCKATYHRIHWITRQGTSLIQCELQQHTHATIATIKTLPRNKNTNP